jgi:molybdopterin synthase sulfur carrier subunit
MVTVEFLGPIQIDKKEFDVKSVRELKDELYKIPELEDWLITCAIAVNNKIIDSLDTPLKDGDHVVLLPPVCGG